MDNRVLMETILRVERMECSFDALESAFENDPASIGTDAALQALLRGLKWYYEGGQWLKDYKTDENGFLPMNLKRGVLSEDGVYDLFSSLDALGE